MKKKLLVMLLIVSLGITGVSMSFGASEPDKYAETDDELIQAENQINTQVAQIKEKDLKDLDVMEKSLDSDKASVQASDTNDKATKKKKISECRQYLKNLKSYKDFKTNSKIEDVEKMLNDRGYSINKEFAQMCKEISKYKDANPVIDTKDIVKHFNYKAGLKEKPKKVKLFSFSFGVSAFALSYSDWTRLTTSEKLLIATDPKAALMTDSIKDIAFKWTQEKFGNNGLGDKSDGYRHGVWNALMTRDISRAWADAYATAHEDRSQQELNRKAADGYYEYQHKSMDLHNNQVGRDQIAWYEFFFNCSDSTVKSRISAKLTNKSADIIWLHN
jgi:hypothetical protein